MGGKGRGGNQARHAIVAPRITFCAVLDHACHDFGIRWWPHSATGASNSATGGLQDMRPE